MGLFLGIDTSNYTTSTALYNSTTGRIIQQKRLLPVPEGKTGLRQQEAVFEHVRQLGPLLDRLLRGRSETEIDAVGVSASPRDAHGSYMPCFLTGVMAAESVAAALQVPVYRFSHQAGHVAAVLYGAGKMDLWDQEFLAFHVSGGTTECLRVSPGRETVFDISILAGTLDLHAGQAVDRIGAVLGLPFPAGKHLEELALRAEGTPPKLKPALQGADCCLSGIENHCQRLLDQGYAPEDIALCSIRFVGDTILAMTKQVCRDFPGLPLVYAGGVMSNSIIRDQVCSQFDACFAKPEFSSDNAAGTSVLCAKQHYSNGEE